MRKSNVVSREYHQQIVKRLKEESENLKYDLDTRRTQMALLESKIADLKAEGEALRARLTDEQKKHEYTRAVLSGTQTRLQKADEDIVRFRKSIAAIGKVAEIAF